jgi:hypothetical protein
MWDDGWDDAREFGRENFKLPFKELTDDEIELINDNFCSKFEHELAVAYYSICQLTGTKSMNKITTGLLDQCFKEKYRIGKLLLKELSKK